MILRVLDEMNKDEKVRIIDNAHDLVNARYLWKQKAKQLFVLKSNV